jgi:hypothetical protein
MAAAAIGLCTSHDSGVTWNVEQEDLHAPYCSAVAFAGDDVLVSASVGPFAAQGQSTDEGSMETVRWSPSPVARLHGSTASPTPVASLRTVRSRGR